MSEAPAGHLVAAGRPRHRGAGLTRAGNAVYLALASGAARYLGRCAIVESVYARRSLPRARSRSVAATSISEFACTTPAPARGRASRSPVREAFDRSAFLLHGAPFRIPPWRIGRDDAAARFCFWFDRYLPIALRRRHRRNLRKFALAMWATLGIMEGHFGEPPLSRQEMETAWRCLAPETGPPHPRASYEELASTAFALARRAHGLLLPPLPCGSRHASAVLPVPPLRGWRTVEVGPVRRLLEGDRRQPGSMPMTPEAFDLYLHYVNPFVYHLLPPQMLDFGFAALRCSAT